MAGKGVIIVVSKNTTKNFIFDDSVTEEGNHLASSDEKTRGKWKVARRTKRKIMQVAVCTASQDSDKMASSSTQQKGKVVKETDRSNICNGNCKKQCGKPVEDDEEGGIACDICMHWFHPSCQDLTQESYKMLKDAQLVWLCSQCRKQLPKVRTLIETLGQSAETQPANLSEMSALLDVKMQDLLKDQSKCHQKQEKTILACAARIESSAEGAAKHTMASVLNKTEDIMAKNGHQIT